MSKAGCVVGLMTIIGVGCGGKAVNVGDVSGDDSGAPSVDSGAPSSTAPHVGTDAGGPPHYVDAGSVGSKTDASSRDANTMDSTVAPPPEDGGSCAATCTTPAGPIAPLPDVPDSGAGGIPAPLVGKWIICGGQLNGAAAGVAGLEFDANGDLALLVENASGQLVAGAGFAYQGTFSVIGDFNGDDYYQLNLSYGGPGTYLDEVAYSPCPLELSISQAMAGGPTLTLVPAGS
jgi:hypothetical protein